RPLEETWLARDNAKNFAALVKYSDAYMPGARRFDVGETCTPTILPGAVAALEQIKVWEVEEISNSLALINKTIALHLEQLGFHLPNDPQRCPHMFGALLPKQYKGNLVSELSNRNIYISQRGNALRFAPHLHVNDHDINRLLEALEELVR
ncbi:MAG: aminotransferase, partial [Deltaproteobacteria bacterium]|nr:aminotransferase [Deltaproteobacteria bacterium]